MKIDGGAKRPQGFCSECGTPIYATSDGGEPKVYGIRAGTIRQRDQLVPKRQAWSRSERHWLAELAAMPKIEKQ